MFDRLSKLIKGFLSLFISGLETANPRALLEAESQGLREAVGNYNKNLARQAGLVERLKMQVQREKQELDRATAQAKALYSAKQMEAAARLALQVKNLNSSLANNQAQLEQADKMYRDLSQKRDVYVREAQKRIDAIKQKLSQAEIAEAQAQLAEIATATAFDLAGSGDTLKRLEEKLDERVTDAMGKARVASDSAAGGEWALKAEEESALEKQALAEFAVAMGLEAPAAPVAAPAQEAPPAMERDLGPAQGA